LRRLADTRLVVLLVDETSLQEVRVRLTDGRIRPFTRLAPKPGRRRCGWVEACKKAGWVRCRAVGLWRGPYKEP
jgi:hypothetical protein